MHTGLIIVVVILVVLFLAGSVSGKGENGTAGSSYPGNAESRKINERRLYLQSFFQENKKAIQLAMREFMDQNYALNRIGLPDSLREKLIFLWLYDAEEANKVYLVLNANLRGEKVLFEFEKGNSIFFKEIFTPEDRKAVMSASAFAAELMAGEELENSLRHYDGSAKSRKAIELFNDADGFMRRNQTILAPNLESWIQYSSTMALK